MSEQQPEILIRRDGRAGRITLNRPKAMNALTMGMVREMTAALESWRNDPEVGFILLDGAGERGLCAGGDIRALVTSGKAKDGEAERFWREEYRLNAMISGYRKPYVALMDGVVMGGGIGVSSHGSVRVVTDRTLIAMPEVGIGLIPDVGATWLLSRPAGEVGLWLALTGARIHGADAIYAGLADSLVPAESLPALTAALCEAGVSDPAAVVATFAQPTPAAPLAERRNDIDVLLARPSVDDIVAFARSTGGATAEEFLNAIADKSPTSLKLTFEALRRGRASRNLEACLETEYRIVTRILEGADFYEGVRAAVIDKDRNPRWSPASLDAVPAEAVARHFEPLSVSVF